MQEELQLTLTVIGGLVIIGVLLHGLWTTRKHKKKNKRADFESRNWEPELEHVDDLESEGPIYDDVGVGQARVVINPSPKPKENMNELFGEADEAFSDNEKAFSETDKAFSETDKSHFENNKNNDNTELANETELDETEVDDPNAKAKRLFGEENEDLAFGNTQINAQENVASNNVVPLDSNLARTSNEKLSAVDPNKLDDAALGANADDIDSILKGDIASTNNDLAQDDAAVQSDISLDNDELKKTSPPPMYSNVVTQPKPEFNKPVTRKDTSDENIGAPPEFLLKKSNELGEQELKKHHGQGDESNKPSVKQGSDDINQPTPNAEPAPDFSLNIQDGPIGQPTSAKSNTSNEEATEPSEPTKKKEPEKNLSLAEQARRFVRRNKKTVAEKIRKEPVLKAKADNDQMRIDFDENDKQSSETSNTAQTNSSLNTSAELNENKSRTSPQGSSQESTQEPKQESKQETDVLVLNVRASDENPIQGAALLPMLLTLGFKFGEHDIFHRHVNTNGKGPILFSLTNMFKPGVFDIDNIENFTTYGLSLFMMLPIEGDAQQVFNMMHNAARKLSQEFDCRILDGNKVGLSKQSLQQYVERIREFERKRINR
jgi:cell division protein ZipA